MNWPEGKVQHTTQVLPEVFVYTALELAIKPWRNFSRSFHSWWLVAIVHRGHHNVLLYYPMLQETPKNCLKLVMVQSLEASLNHQLQCLICWQAKTIIRIQKYINKGTQRTKLIIHVITGR